MMQSQGLGALMPQGAQQAPQMNNPRLAAATNLVSSDAEEQILDPRTLAMLKYKDALQAMQAADQMMAASQPAPMPPTVAERTKMAAEQGIAGLASRLSPGLQQQGNRMQTQQMQQAVSGGLPQLSAPNMAGMAEGGIVGFQAGGAPEDAYAQPTDYLLPGRVGMLPRENLPTTREELLTEIARLERMQEQAERRRNPNQSQTTPSDGGDAQSRTTDAYAQPTDYLLPGRVGMLPRENLPTTREELQAEIERRERMRKLMENLQELDRTEVPGPYSGPSAAERRAMREEGRQTPVPSNTYGTGDRTSGQGRSVMEELRSARDVIGQGLASIFNGVPGGSNIVDFTAEGSPIYAGRSSAQSEPASTVAINETTPLEGSTLNLSALDGGAQTSTPASQTSLPVSPSGGEAVPVLDLDALIASLSPSGGTNVSTPPSRPYQEYESAMMDPNAPETAREAAEARYRAAIDPSMEELKELIRSRSAALDAPLYSPEEQRSREISALLGGLASSNLIAQGGPAASRGVREVEDAVRADARTRAERQFELSSGLIGQGRTAAEGALAAGEEAFGASNTQRAQVYQSVIAQFNSANEIEAAQILGREQRAFDSVKTQLEIALERGRQNLLSEQNKTQLSATVANRIQDATTALADLASRRPLLSENPTALEAIDKAIRLQENEINQLRTRSAELLGLSGEVMETGGANNNNNFIISPDIQSDLDQYSD
jgi:hypothetical protein